MKITESYVHVAMREFLKKEGWLLIAGEYPNGSDDELNVLSISDPTVARDHSPRIIDEYKADLYIKGKVKVHKRNHLIRYVPSMFRFKNTSMIILWSLLVSCIIRPLIYTTVR